MWYVHFIACALIFLISLSNTSELDESGGGAFRRIVGGEPSEDFQWFVTIYFAKSNRFCGGSAIEKYALLTAAHCFKVLTTLKSIRIYHGKGELYKRSSIEPRSAIIHPKFQFINQTTFNDIAIVFTKQPLDDYINWIWPTPAPGTEAWYAGYGGTLSFNYDSYEGDFSQEMSTYLRKTKVTIIDNIICNKLVSQYEEMVDSKICTKTKGTGSCQGDSGGPLYGYDENNIPVLYGIISQGYGCADEKYPDIDVRISSYQIWIHHTLLCAKTYSGILRG